jgi:hypothetical protein
MKIHIPNSAFLGNIDPFIVSFDPSESSILEITSNPNWISIHPVILSMIASLGSTVEPSKIRIEKLTAVNAHYLKTMGLFNILNVPCNMNIQQHAPEGKFIPLSRINTSDELSKFISEMIPLLHQPQHAKTIGYIISELGRNVLEHALAKHGAIMCAQYFKKSNTIRIGIADTGLGIKRTINASHPAGSHLDAIQLALWPGITGVTRKRFGNDQNGGAGLFFIRAIANVNRDHFFIYSGDAFYKLLRKKTGHINLNADPFKDKHSVKTGVPFWQGTVVGIDINLDETEDYAKLISEIQKTYWSLRKEKTSHKKPIFL